MPPCGEGWQSSCHLSQWLTSMERELQKVKWLDLSQRLTLSSGIFLQVKCTEPAPWCQTPALPQVLNFHGTEISFSLKELQCGLAKWFISGLTKIDSQQLLDPTYTTPWQRINKPLLGHLKAGLILRLEPWVNVLPDHRATMSRRRASCLSIQQVELKSKGEYR